MKKTVLLISMCMIGSLAFGQGKKNAAAIDTIPEPYLQSPTVPPFKILLTDSSWFTKEDLPKKKLVVVMYFSPDCSHCQLQTQEILDSMRYFKEAFFVMAAYKKMPDIQEFSTKYKLDEYKNIKIGRDTAYFLPSFYRVKFTPFIAVYDRGGRLLKTFAQGAKIEELKALM